MPPFDQLSTGLACHNLQPQNEKRVDELLIPLIVIATLIELCRYSYPSKFGRPPRKARQSGIPFRNQTSLVPNLPPNYTDLAYSGSANSLE